MIRPVGHYVLIEVPPIDEKSDGGIILAKETRDKEHRGTEVGFIKAFGPTAYKEWPGCTDPDIPPHLQYGVKVGDKVEFRRYEGKICALNEELRYIPDSHVLGVIEDE